MQERAQFEISALVIESLKAGLVGADDTLLNELLSNQKQVEDLLISYHFRSRGRVYNVRIDKPVLNDDGSGFFNVRYSIGHFNACADVDTSEDERMKIQFEVNLQTGILFLVGEFIPEREPDEF